MKLLAPKKAGTLTQKKPAAPTAPLNFLLGCSQTDLSNFELAKLAAVANLRAELHQTLDKIIDEMTQAGLAAWFKQTDRETLTRALKVGQDRIDEILSWAKERIRNKGKSEEELLPRPLLPAGAAHLAAQLLYSERNLAEGKCSVCPRPRAPHSVRYCQKHLTYTAKRTANARARKKPWAGKGDAPGTIGYLYGDGVFESPRGRQPGTLAALKEANEKRAKKKKT